MENSLNADLGMNEQKQKDEKLCRKIRHDFRDAITNISFILENLEAGITSPEESMVDLRATLESMKRQYQVIFEGDGPLA